MARKFEPLQFGAFSREGTFHFGCYLLLSGGDALGTDVSLKFSVF